MKEKANENTKSGWFEEKDPVLGKAKRHHEVATKEKLKDTLRTPLCAPIKREDKDEEEELTEEIVEEVQSKRKPQAIAKDDSKTAEKVGNKEDAEDLVDWIKNPGESDLEGVDTKKK